MGSLAAAVGGVFGTASGTVAGVGGGIDGVLAIGADGSDFGEQAAKRATTKHGVVTMKRLRVGNVVMSIFLENYFWNFSLGIAAGRPDRCGLVSA